MLKQTVALALLATFVAVSACDRGTIVATGPSSQFTDGGALGTREPSFSISPTSLVAQLSGRSPCPQFHPFRVFTNLSIRTGEEFGFRLTSIDMRFFDRSGLSAPTVTLPAPVPTQQFGTDLINARSFREFPLEFGFGCGTGRFGTIVIIVNGFDGRGHRTSQELRASVM